MNTYFIETSAGPLTFEATDSDFAVWEANKINRVPVGETERVEMYLICENGYKQSIGSFDLMGAYDEEDEEEPLQLYTIGWSTTNPVNGISGIHTREHLMEYGSDRTLCGIELPPRWSVLDIGGDVGYGRCKRCNDKMLKMGLTKVNLA